MEKRKRGRPKKDPSLIKPKIPTSGKRGRPKRDAPKEELLTYNSSKIELRKALGHQYLRMSGGEYEEEIIANFLRKIEETPAEDFPGRGFDIFREILNKVKDGTIFGEKSFI